MERPARLARKCAVFAEALRGFETSLRINAEAFDPVVADAIRNGCVQKFEYCTELCWKLIRQFLLEIHGIMSSSPKSAAKEYLLAGLLDEQGYESLIAMIDDRNSLSHIYVREEFERIHANLDHHLDVMKQIACRICEGA